MAKKFVIALGGSIAFPETIDVVYLKKFFHFIKKELGKGNKFIIVCGGGHTCRKYQVAASKITKLLDEDKDWIGIHSTRLNAHFLRTLFRKEAHPALLKKRFRIKTFGEHSVIIGSGWQPGWSTDFVTVQSAADFNIEKVIILGKPDYVYTSDFEKDKNAKPIYKISWSDYLKLIPAKWTPGMHAPVDPIAAKLAKTQKIEVIVTGKDLKNLKNILDGKKFKGTILS